MADQKISELTSIGESGVSIDYLPIVDLSAMATKRIQLSSLMYSGVTQMIKATSGVSIDMVPILDQSGTTMRKIAIKHLDGIYAAPARNPLAFAQGINMAAAASGSNGIQVADNDNIDFRTGNFTLVWRGRFPDWTPATTIRLIQKYLGNGPNLAIGTDGKISFSNGYNSYTTTNATGFTDRTCHEIVLAVGYAENLIIYLDGGLFYTVAYSGGDLDNATPLYILGTNTERTEGTVHHVYTYNRALTAAQVLALYELGRPDDSDKWGSQTELVLVTSGSADNNTFASDTGWWTKSDGTVTISGGVCHFTTSSGGQSLYRNGFATTGKRHRVTYTILNYSSGGVAMKCGSIGTTRTANGTYTEDLDIATGAYLQIITTSGGTTLDIDNVEAYEIGATLALEPEGAQPAPGQWLDSSSNKLHAMQPATGSSLIRFKKDFEFRWTNTWTASAAAQYIGGVNWDVLTAKHYITLNISKTTETTDVENIEIGDEADPNRFVTAAAPGTSAAPVSHTIALAIPDGVNGQFVVTPAASATMTIEFIVRGFLLEP